MIWMPTCRSCDGRAIRRAVRDRDDTPTFRRGLQTVRTLNFIMQLRCHREHFDGETKTKVQRR